MTDHVSDELIRALVDAAPDALVMIDHGGAIELVNRRTEELFGYRRDALLGRPVGDLIPELSRRIDPSPMAMDTGQLPLGYRADGTEFPIEISLNPVTTSEGQWMIAAVRDVSERLESERHIRAIRHAIETANDGLFIIDPTTFRFTYANRVGRELHGYTIDEMLTLGPLHLAVELERPDLQTELAPLLSGETETVTLRIRGLRRDGTEFPAEVLINQPASVELDGSRPLVAVVRDMTERVLIEQALAESRSSREIFDERERFARDLHDSVIGDLFGVGMSLQSSLTPASVASGVAAKRVEAAVETIDRVISKIRSAIFGLNTSNDHGLFVSDRLRQLVELFEPRLGYAPTLIIDGNVDELSAEIVEQLIPTVEETLNNVAKHAESSRTDIHISVTDQVIVRVVDNGVGIDAGVATNGGLGHGNVRRRAELLAGSCTIESGRQGGLTVTWTVPLR